MYADSTEVTLSPTTVVCHDGELDSLQTLHFSHLFIVWVLLSRKREIRVRIHLIFIKIITRWRLNEKTAIYRLAETFCRDWVIVIIEVIKEVYIFLRCIDTCLMGWKLNILIVWLFRDVADTSNISIVLFSLYRLCKLFKRYLTHTIDHNISFRVKKDRFFHLV